MDWLRDRVWELGIGILLVIVGAALMYLDGADDGEMALIGLGGIGMVLFALALAIPLVRKAVQVAQDDEASDEEA